MKPEKNWMFRELEEFNLFDKSEDYPKNKISLREVYELAKFMHNVCEKASQQVNWKLQNEGLGDSKNPQRTQKKYHVDFHELSDEDRRVMMIVSNMILGVIYRDCKKR